MKIIKGMIMILRSTKTVIFRAELNALSKSIDVLVV